MSSGYLPHKERAAADPLLPLQRRRSASPQQKDRQRQDGDTFGRTPVTSWVVDDSTGMPLTILENVPTEDPQADGDSEDSAADRDWNVEDELEVFSISHDESEDYTLTDDDDEIDDDIDDGDDGDDGNENESSFLFDGVPIVQSMNSISSSFGITREKRNLKYVLEIVQQPKRARACGFGNKDRRPLSPPPIIQLKIYDELGINISNEVDIHHLILTVDLWSGDKLQSRSIIEHGGQKNEHSFDGRTLTGYAENVEGGSQQPFPHRSGPIVTGVDVFMRSQIHKSSQSFDAGLEQTGSQTTTAYPREFQRITSKPHHTKNKEQLSRHLNSSLGSPLPTERAMTLQSPGTRQYHNQHQYQQAEQSSSKRPYEQGHSRYEHNQSSVGGPILHHELGPNPFRPGQRSSLHQQQQSPGFDTTTADILNDGPTLSHMSGWTPMKDPSRLFRQAAGQIFSTDQNFSDLDLSSVHVEPLLRLADTGSRSSLYSANITTDPHSLSTASSISVPKIFGVVQSSWRLGLESNPAQRLHRPHTASSTEGFSFGSSQAHIRPRPRTTGNEIEPTYPYRHPTSLARGPPARPSRLLSPHSPEPRLSHESLFDVPPLSSPYSRCLIGNLATNCYRLKNLDNEDGLYFVTPDLSIRSEGIFTLRYKLSDVSSLLQNAMSVQNPAKTLGEVYSNPFISFSAKRFPGVARTTELSRHFCEQGVRITVRNQGRTSSQSSGRSK